MTDSPKSWGGALARMARESRERAELKTDLKYEVWHCLEQPHDRKWKVILETDSLAAAETIAEGWRNIHGGGTRIKEISNEK